MIDKHNWNELPPVSESLPYPRQTLAEVCLSCIAQLHLKKLYLQTRLPSMILRLQMCFMKAALKQRRLCDTITLSMTGKGEDQRSSSYVNDLFCLLTTLIRPSL